MKKNNPGQAVSAALQVPDPNQFVLAASGLDLAHPGVPFHERPEPLAIVGGLCALARAVSSGGIRQFIDQQEGVSFHEIESYCRMIGATRASEYLLDAAALFPDGRVPRDDMERFDIAVAYEPTSPLDPPDPFLALDKKYADAMPDMVAKLREHVTRNADALARALAGN